MKKLLPLLCLLLLCGCTQQSPADEPPPTVPLHSDLYLPGLEVDEVLTYFNEVCLDAEITNSGDPSRLQKWDAPLRYTLLSAAKCALSDSPVLGALRRLANGKD